jgi:hypothetical protein
MTANQVVGGYASNDATRLALLSHLANKALHHDLRNPTALLRSFVGLRARLYKQQWQVWQAVAIILIGRWCSFLMRVSFTLSHCVCNFAIISKRCNLSAWLYVYDMNLKEMDLSRNEKCENVYLF